MRKKNKLVVFEEINGEFIPKTDTKRLFEAKSDQFVLSFAGFSSVLSTATPVLANAGSTVDAATGGIYSTLMDIFDAAVVFIIMFAGGAWALGHRSKAIHLLICVSCGYFLARNAVNIRDFMRDI